MTKLKALITEFSDVFALDNSEVGCTDVVKHSIDTGDHAPFKQQPYCTPVIRREKMAAMIRAMEDQGVVSHICAVNTDYAAWLSILNTSRPSGKLARWALTIQEMDINADALSCNLFPSGEVESLVCAVQQPDQTGELQCDNVLQQKQA
jgi:hypothetical protein